MNIKIYTIAAMAVATSTLASAQQCSCETGGKMAMTTGRVAGDDVQTLLRSWKDEPRKAAMKMIGKYGQPNEATATRMVWFNNGPWKYSILTNEEIPHEFPMHHHDMLRQVIDYRVSPDAVDELSKYDSSVIVDRTPGELSARCDKEEANFLAINLAHDVATKRRSVPAARAFYAKAVMAMMKGNQNREQRAYLNGFVFRLPQGGTGFKDKPAKMGG